jgi:nuclear GTP-binding protein
MSANDSYSAEKDHDLVTEEPEFKDEKLEVIFKAGQSKRVWGELYKVFFIFHTCVPCDKTFLLEH